MVHWLLITMVLIMIIKQEKLYSIQEANGLEHLSTVCGVKITLYLRIFKMIGLKTKFNYVRKKKKKYGIAKQINSFKILNKNI